MSEGPFIYPEALKLLSIHEAKDWVHDGCPFCADVWEMAQKYVETPGARMLVNTETRDVLGVFIQPTTREAVE